MSETASSAPSSAAPQAQAAPATESVDSAEGLEGLSADAEGSEGSEDSDKGPMQAEVEKAQKKEAASRKKKYQLKVDGRDEEYELDLDNDEEIKKHLQMSKASQKRMQESAEYKKSVAALIDKLQNNPLEVLDDPRLGISEEAKRKIAESFINREIEDMQKTPEQKEKEKLQKEYEQLKKQYEDEKRQTEEAAFAQMQEQAAVQLDTEISTAIESSGLPKSARTVRIMAEAMMFCLDNDLDLSPRDLVPYVKKQTVQELKEVAESMTDEDFEGWAGDRIKRLRKKNLAKIKASQGVPDNASSIKPTTESAKPKENSGEQKKISMKEFFNTIGKF